MGRQRKRPFGYSSSGLWLLGLVATRSGGETDIFDALSGPLELAVDFAVHLWRCRKLQNNESYSSCGGLIKEPWRGF